MLLFNYLYFVLNQGRLFLINWNLFDCLSIISHWLSVFLSFVRHQGVLDLSLVPITAVHLESSMTHHLQMFEIQISRKLLNILVSLAQVSPCSWWLCSASSLSSSSPSSASSSFGLGWTATIWCTATPWPNASSRTSASGSSVIYWRWRLSAAGLNF